MSRLFRFPDLSCNVLGSKISHSLILNHHYSFFRSSLPQNYKHFLLSFFLGLVFLLPRRMQIHSHTILSLLVPLWSNYLFPFFTFLFIPLIEATMGAWWNIFFIYSCILFLLCSLYLAKFSSLFNFCIYWNYLSLFYYFLQLFPTFSILSFTLVFVFFIPSKFVLLISILYLSLFLFNVWFFLGNYIIFLSSILVLLENELNLWPLSVRVTHPITLPFNISSSHISSFTLYHGTCTLVFNFLSYA